MLTLRITHGRMCGMTRTLDRSSLVIGRGSGCDWILHDADRILSGQHCRVSWIDGQYILTDTSSNGVFHNHAAEPVGRGGSVVLADGDSLMLGDYEMVVAIGRPPPADVQDVLGESDFGDPPPPSFPSFSVADDARMQRGGDLEYGYPAAGVVAAEPDHIPALHESFAAVRPAAATPNDATPPPGGVDDFMALLSDANFLSGGAETAAATPSWTPDAPASDGFPSGLDEPLCTIGADAPAQPEPRAEPLPAVPAIPASAVAGHPSADLLAVFLDAAGLPAAAGTTPDPVAAMRVAGTVYRQTVEGLCALLAMRSQVKSEFRIERTIIGSRDNNPLKFSTDAMRTAQQLLQQPLPGFLPAEEAVRRSFRDIQQHELAASIGMQSALSALLRRFDPDALKERLDRQSLLASFVPAARRARYWELYEALYQEIAAEAESDFQSLFGREFAQAYERQIRAMSGPDAPASAGPEPHSEGESP